MGSASTQALAATSDVFAEQSLDLAAARDLFAAARTTAGSSHLGGALADPAASPEARKALVAAVFGQLGATARAVVEAAALQRWSSTSDLVDGLEELAIRAAASSEPSADVARELFDVSRVVSQNAELELTLGGTLGDPAGKAALIEKLIDGQASAASTLIVAELVRSLRGRRVRSVLREAISIVAAQAGRTVATVTVAAPLNAVQAERLAATLSKIYGGDIALNQVVDAGVVGGIRVQVADDIIDGSISTRLTDLRHKLAS
ncbi:F0F1 ATP synthase subunit delta [Microbacterium halophytorum]|uniref:F0F1 ATP synthase subunit delta n=1 Tax=Microbacterium halophytorum TaxID=2067568 RepID=UPI000CFDE547|nr:F0F1 ATP synthase subunit delta [Microbacterium halophytorum]